MQWLLNHLKNTFICSNYRAVPGLLKYHIKYRLPQMFETACIYFSKDLIFPSKILWNRYFKCRFYIVFYIFYMFNAERNT